MLVMRRRVNYAVYREQKDMSGSERDEQLAPLSARNRRYLSCKRAGFYLMRLRPAKPRCYLLRGLPYHGVSLTLGVFPTPLTLRPPSRVGVLADGFP